MTHVYPWCSNCGQVATLRRDTLCVRCEATFDALCSPIDPHPPIMRAPALLRFLRWLGGTQA